MVTLKDLSRVLNLSVTQVSRALNGHDDVNEETRKRVMAAARDLNYHPNLTARKLASGRSGIVGLVLPRYPRLSSDRMMLESVLGLSAQFSRRDMLFVLHIARESEDIVNVYRRLIDGGSLDGFVLLETSRKDDRIDYLRKRGIPFVVHGRSEAAPDYPYFDVDNYGLSYKSTLHLLDRGHGMIALINGPEQANFALERFEGYRDAHAKAGLAVSPHLVRHGRMSDSLGVLSTVQFFSGSAATHPTAVICGSMSVAEGVYQAAMALGLSIPRDLSVIAHDDVIQDEASLPVGAGLVVTRAPIAESWSPLADFLVGAIEGRPVEALQRFGEVAFVDGSSVATIS